MSSHPRHLKCTSTHAHPHPPIHKKCQELPSKIVKNVHLRPLTIPVKKSILDAWLSPKYAYAGGYNIVVEIQTKIPL